MICSWFANIANFILIFGCWQVKAKLSDKFPSVIKGHELFLPNTENELLREHQAEEQAQDLNAFGIIEEGDIKVTELFQELRNGKKQNFWTQSSYHWDPKAIPYKIYSESARSLKNPECEGIVDVGFILDSSGSLKYEYSDEKEFLKDLASTFNISRSGSHAAVVTFSSRAELSIKLNDFFDQTQFNRAVDNIRHMDQSTRIDLALRKALEIFDESNGARSKVPQLLFLLTDGKQETSDLQAENPGDVAKHIQNKGIEIVAVGIGSGVSQTELINIAGSNERVFLAKDFHELINGNFLKKVKEGSCALGNLEKEFALSKNNLVVTLKTIEEEFVIYFELKPTLYSPGYHSVLRIELGNNKYIAIWFSESGLGTLVITSVFGTIYDEVKSKNNILLYRWVTIKVSQQVLGGKYIYTVEVGGKILFSKENFKAVRYSSVAVYATDRYEFSQAGFIRNLKISNGNEGFISKQEKPLERKEIVAVLPKLEKDFVLTFDVQLHSLQNFFYNVIQLSDSTGYHSYPSFWLHKSSNSLSASSLINNKQVTFNQQSLSFNVWSKISLSQHLIAGSYIYSIKVNGINVYYNKIRTPIELNTVKIYAASPDAPTQAGLIRNLKVAQGKQGNLHLKNPDCEGFVDVGFILDSSGSLQNHYRQETFFLKKLANSFGISSRGSHAGVIAFSHVAELSIRLDEFFDDITFNEAVDKIRYMGSTTRIDLALEKALELFDESNGARKDVPKLLFLLTDGEQTGNENPVLIANQLRQKGIEIFAIGIGNGVKKAELDNIADKPENVFLVDDFYKLVEGNFLNRVKQGSCNSVLENLKNEAELKSDNLLVTLLIKKEFVVSFDIKPTSYLSGYHSVLKMEMKAENYIAVWFSENGNGTLIISSVFGTIHDEVKSEKTILLDRWTTIKISQQLLSGNYKYIVEVGGKILFSRENKIAEEFSSVFVYAADKEHNSQAGFIRNLVIKNGNEGYILRKETRLESGKLLVTLPKLTLEYTISFEVKPENTVNLLNIFQIMNFGGAVQYGQEQLAMWIDEGFNGKLTSGINNNFLMDFPNQIPVQKWISIRISQQFFNNKYLCEVELNGKEIFSRENPDAKDNFDLKLYVTSPLHNSASGLIRNILIINGHADIELRKVVQAAITDFHDFTCLNFVQHEDQIDYLSFIPKKGCYSKVGKNGGEQKISVGSECRWKGTVTHLIMHSLGFLHETSRTDRDRAVDVQYSNMEQKFIDNFRTYDAGQTLGLHYDYFSIMHYGAYAFSSNGLPTLRSLSSNIGIDILGQRDGFSEEDIKRINTAYQCDNGNIDPNAPELPAPITTPTPLPPKTKVITTPVPIPPISTPPPVSTPPPLPGKAPPKRPPISTPAILPPISTPATLPPISTPPPLPPLSTPPSLPSTPPVATATTTSLKSTPASVSDFKVTSAIPIPPSVTPTRVNIKTDRPCKQNYFPCWPFDFTISHTVHLPCCLGLNSPQDCKCRCIFLNSQQVGRGIKRNFLCHKKSVRNPGFVLSDVDKHPMKKCIRLPIDNSEPKRFLCYLLDSGYHLRWADGSQNKNCIQSTEAPFKDILCNDII